MMRTPISCDTFVYPHQQGPVEVYYEIHGDRKNPPLLYIHGWNGTLESFRTNVCQYFDQYCVVLIDLPGCGNSLHNNITYEILSDLILAFLDQLAIAQVALMGFSMGSSFALDFAIRNPTRVKLLLLVEPLIRLPLILYPLLCRLLHKPVYSFFVRNALGLAIFQRLMLQKGHPYREQFFETFRQVDSKTSQAYLHLVWQYAKIDHCERMKPLQIPVSIIVGNNPSPLLQCSAQQILKSIPQARLHRIPQAGHFPIEEQPTSFAQTVRHLLEPYPAHIGIYTPTGMGHINTIMPLALELQNRGYRVSFLNCLDLEDHFQTLGVGFLNAYPGIVKGTQPQFLRKLRHTKGAMGIWHTVQWTLACAKEFMAHGPRLLCEHKVDLLLVDQISMEGLLVAEHLHIPALTICSALPLNQQASLPPIFLNWKYKPSLLSNLAYGIVHAFSPGCGWHHLWMLWIYKQRFGLRGKIRFNSPLGSICHEPKSFEFPRTKLPNNFHFVGPMHTVQSRIAIDFPWEKCSHKPILYASLGSIHESIRLYQIIAHACSELPYQIILNVGENVDAPELQNISHNSTWNRLFWR